MEQKITQKRLIGVAITFALSSIIFYGGLKALPFIVAMVFVIGMSGMLFFRVFLKNTLYFKLAFGLALGASMVLTIGWLYTAFMV